MFSIFRSLGYCPAGVTKCSRAASHHAVEVKGNSPQYCDECEEELKVGKHQVLHGAIAAGWAVTIALTAFAVKWYIFPTSLSGVSFATAQTEVKGTAATVNISVTLDKQSTSDVQVRYKTLPGSAEPGSDYVETSGSLYFPAGSTTQSVSIHMLPNTDVTERNESFTVQLDNVEGKPGHEIVIIEEGVNKDLLDKTNLLVSSLSTLSADLANDVISLTYLLDYLNASGQPAQDIVKKYNQMQSNVLRAREKYLLLFKDSGQLDPKLVMKAIDNRLAALKRGGFEGEYIAAMVMKKQLLTYLNTRIPEPDTWLHELSEAIQSKKDSKKITNPKGV